jgi:hypothetical protein
VLVLCKQAKVWLGAWFGAKQGIRCGFPVKKGISVGTRIQVGRAGCGQFRMRCCAGAVPSKQVKQTSKGLVFDAVRVR